LTAVDHVYLRPVDGLGSNGELPHRQHVRLAVHLTLDKPQNVVLTADR
jgi:hypothetical protein